MFQNKIRPAVSEDEEEEQASPKRRGKSEWRKVDDAICEAVSELLFKEAIAPIRRLRKRVKDLEKQIENVQAFPFRYRGVWKVGHYRMNESVTFKGCLWIALVSTETKPGESRHWQLAVKAGRDGKDAPR